VEDEERCQNAAGGVEGDTCTSPSFMPSYFTIGMYASALALVIYMVLWIKRKVEQLIARVKAIFGGGSKVEQNTDKMSEGAPFIADEEQGTNDTNESWDGDNWDEEQEPTPDKVNSYVQYAAE
jgi:hypothetical protein